MKILLVQNYYNKGDGVVFPLGLSYLATKLYEHQVRGFDPNLSTNPYHELKNILREFKPDIVCISIRNADRKQGGPRTYQFVEIEKKYKLIKSELSDSKIIVGGAFFSMFPIETMEVVGEIDFGASLEAEDSLPELLVNL